MAQIKYTKGMDIKSVPFFYDLKKERIKKGNLE